MTYPLPSSLLEDGDWIERLTCLQGDKTPTEYNTNTADKLSTLIHGRLKHHINRRVLNSDKREHWVWDFFRENIHVMCAISVHYGHIKKDVSFSNPSSCLLSNVSSFLDASNSYFATLAGAYLIINTNDEKAVRSGKAVNMGERQKQHARSAKLPDAAAMNALFYRSYPDTSVVHKVDTSARRGTFQMLSQRIALAFDIKKRTHVTTICGSGIFVWSKLHLDRIKKPEFEVE